MGDSLLSEQIALQVITAEDLFNKRGHYRDLLDSGDVEIWYRNERDGLIYDVVWALPVPVQPLDEAYTLFTRQRQSNRTKMINVPSGFELQTTPGRTEIKGFKIEDPTRKLPPMICDSIGSLQRGLEGFFGENFEYADSIEYGMELKITVVATSTKAIKTLREWEP